MNRETKTINISILLGITIVLIGAVFYFVAPIPQDLAYHQFVDQRVFLSIPNFLNVFSNLAFIIIGIHCLRVLFLHKHEINGICAGSAYYFFFIGLILTGFGSGYYHLSPDNQTLVWDRLPMAIAFMALFSFFLSEHINARLGIWLLWPLLAIGVFSVLYWIYTENQGAGDLRLYALVQFLPVLLIPLIIILFPSHTYRKKYIWYLIGLYALAKLSEHYDAEVMNAVAVSGHTLKHFFAAFSGIAFLKIILSKRDNLNHI
jgi:hypothetical protein